MATRRVFLAGAASGLLMALAHPPLALWPLGWIGLWPLFAAVARATRRQTILAGVTFGAVQAAAGMHWLAVTAWVNLIAVAVYHALFYGGALLLLRGAVRGASWFRPVAAAAAWVGLDLLLGRLFSGIPWLWAGYAQAPLEPLIQIADLTGVHGVTFLVALGGAMIAFGPAAEAGRRGAACRQMAPAGAAWLLLVGSAWLYGTARLGDRAATGPEDGAPELLLVQPNIPQALKDSGERVGAEDVFRRNDRLTLEALAAGPRPDLVVWSETMNPISLLPLGNGTSRHFEASRRFYRVRVRDHYQTAFLLGTLHFTEPHSGEDEVVSYFNSAQFFSPAGDAGARFDKLHPIPWAEYIPLGLRFIGHWVEKFAGFPMRMQAGREAVVFPFGDGGRWSFGALICFDVIYPRYARRMARGGARFLVNLTNEAWFGDSAELDQLLAVARFRAIENRMGVVRATNSGISASIDAAGRVRSRLTDAGGRDRSVRGVLKCRPVLREGLTLYTRVGDLFGVSCALLAAIVSLAAAWRRTS